MRLIDADAFERAVMFSDDEDLQDVIYRLRDFPTIEPERKKGRWIRVQTKTKPGTWRYACSECGESPLRSRWDYSDELSCYCPNCGVKMTEES